MNQLRNNDVQLTGRVSDDPELKVLPSGDELARFRLIVDRPAGARKRSRQSVDTFDCVGWTARMRGRFAKLSAGDIVTVRGQLRRQFSRPAGQPTSWVSIELDACSKVAPERSEKQRR